MKLLSMIGYWFYGFCVYKRKRWVSAALPHFYLYKSGVVQFRPSPVFAGCSTQELKCVCTSAVEVTEVHTMLLVMN
jgi:hypothetical protein